MRKTTGRFIAYFLLAIFAALAVSGCGGGSANPIATREVGDRDLDCDEIEAEVVDLDARSRRLLGEKSGKTGKNVAVGVVGLILFWPALFFLDLSDAEKEEAQAMQDRMRHLQRIANKKDCDIF